MPHAGERDVLQPCYIFCLPVKICIQSSRFKTKLSKLHAQGPSRMSASMPPPSARATRKPVRRSSPATRHAVQLTSNIEPAQSDKACASHAVSIRSSPVCASTHTREWGGTSERVLVPVMGYGFRAVSGKHGRDAFWTVGGRTKECGNPLGLCILGRSRFD